jgi:DNA-binding protein H-NS
VEHYGLTPQDVFGKGVRMRGRARKTGTTTPARSARKANPRKGQPVPVKYRDEKGNTWAARGNRPRWLVEALKSGKSLEDFAVKPH